MDWEQIDSIAEHLFQDSIRRVKQKLKDLDPKEREKVARKIAMREVNAWLKGNYGVDWQYVKAKLVGKEMDQSIDDLAV